MNILLLLCGVIFLWILFRPQQPWLKKQYFPQHKFNPQELPPEIKKVWVKLSEWTIDKDPHPNDIASYSDRTFNGTPLHP